MVFRPILATVGALLTQVLAMACIATPAHAADESEQLAASIRFDTPSIYCAIETNHPAATALLNQISENGKPNLMLAGAFADCEQTKAWLGGAAKQQPSRFGAAFLHKSGDSLKPLQISRVDYLKKLEAVLSSWDQSSPRLLLERIVKGAIDAKPQRVQIMATMPEAIFVGFTAEVAWNDGTKKTLAGVTAISQIRQLPVSLHLYRNLDHEGTVGALLPEAMGLMSQWIAQNDESKPVAAQTAPVQKAPLFGVNGPCRGPCPPPPLPPPVEVSLPPLKPAANPERETIRALLLRGEFDTLSRLLTDKQTAFDKGDLSEAQLLNAYATFRSADPNLLEKLDAWVEAQPTSYMPRLARGVYSAHVGWTTRGTEYVGKTASERFTLMQKYFAAATVDFDSALTRNPHLSVAWDNLIDIAISMGQPTLDLYSLGIVRTPSSVELRRTYAFSFLARWGGGLYRPRESFEATIAERNGRWLAFYESLKTDATTVDALAPVIESPSFQAAKRSFEKGDFPAAAQHLLEAFTAGNETMMQAAAGRQHMAKQDFQAAVESFDQALEEEPRWSYTLHDRANTLRQWAHATRNKELLRLALADYHYALAIDPYQPKLLSDAAAAVSGIQALFPDQAEQVFDELWPDSVACEPHAEPPKRFEVVHTMNPRLPTKIYCTAESLYAKTLVYGRDDLDIREMRGRFYLFSMKFPSLAIAEFEAAIELNTENPQTWENYARALHEIGDCRAMAAYRQHIAMCKDGKCPNHIVNDSRRNMSQLSLSSNCGG